jgi:hypothetical protein
MRNNLRFLFYLVHPAKFHFHKIQINELKKKGHKVDILINTKDILEELVKEEGWVYTNIFPNTRKIRGVHVYLAAVISIFKTVYRLLKFTKGKKYDLFIGDLTTILGRLKGVPSLYPTDDVLAAVPEQKVFFSTVNYIIAPIITDVGKYKIKKIGYRGYKALAHLHPNHFKSDENKLHPDLRGGITYYLIRCTGFMATHDINKSGISNDVLYKLVKILKPYGKVLISSERTLPNDLEQYKLEIKKNDITHYINYAQLFISDSTTMSSEAAFLGTPSIEFDDYFQEIEQMIELEIKYRLIHCFRTYEEEAFLNKIRHLLSIENLNNIYQKRRMKLLDDCIDVSSFLVWFYENYPSSRNQYLDSPSVQKKFT